MDGRPRSRLLREVEIRNFELNFLKVVAVVTAVEPVSLVTKKKNRRGRVPNPPCGHQHK